MVNLIVDLDERFDATAQEHAIAAIVGSGCTFDERRGAADATLAWIDETFGGAWSGEAYAGSTVAALRDGRAVGFATYAPEGLRYRWLRCVATEPGVGIFGPFGVNASERGGPLGGALLQAALCSLRTRGYRRALIPAVGDERLQRYYVERVGARVVERFTLRDGGEERIRTIVMASGSGTNFQAVLERVRAGTLPLEIAALVCNTADAFAIERARVAKIPARVVARDRANESRAAYDARLLEAIGNERPQLLLLLGWMHLLAPSFLDAFPDTINVHPAYLPFDATRDEVGLADGSYIPAYRGARAVRDAIAAGSAWSGVSVHVVTPQADSGPILVRMPLYIEGLSEAQVLERLHTLEHDLVPRGIMRWIYER
ncbi:MAG TPA: GNAT family N-acetyltransferase [Candidatus Dormibacteraeota bacterium]|nr:GNAT family N-acetyltransferase [Candidatus Dormibacteraeota bacterium]